METNHEVKIDNKLLKQQGDHKGKSFFQRLKEEIDKKFEADLERQREQLREIGRGFGKDLFKVYETAGKPKGTALDSALAIQSLIISLGEKVLQGNITDPELQRKIAQAVSTLSPVVEGILQGVKPESSGASRLITFKTVRPKK